MIYYIYIFLAVFLFVIQFGVLKLYQKNVIQSLISSLLFVFITSIVAFFIFIIIGGFQITTESVFFALAVAVSILLSNVLGILVISLGKIGVYTMFVMLGGMILPFFYGIIFLQEDITVIKIIGVLIMTISMFLPMFDNKIKCKTRNLFYILCFIAFILNGCVSIFSKANQITLNTVPATNFLVLYSMFSAIFSFIGICIMLSYKKNKKENILILKRTITVKPLLLAVAFAIVNNFGSFLLLISATNIEASLQYPIVTGGTIVLSAIMGKLLFKEKIGKFTLIGLIITFLATTLFVV
jgi:drug/metabolite transporter (DMT)-like permease